MTTQQVPLIPARSVRERFGGISNMTLWRWVQRGILPPPVKINTRNYWRETDVDAVAQPERRA